MAIRIRDVLIQAAPGIFFIAAWQLFVNGKPEREFYLGSPLGIASALNSSFCQGELIRDFGVTMYEAVLGFLFGTSFGTVFGLGLWLSKTVYKMSKPYLIILGALPVFALGPILIFWFGTGVLSKIVIGFLTTFVIALTQAYNGAIGTDKNLLILIKSFGGKKLDAFRKVVVPSSLIWVLAGIRINAGMALLGAFVGEFISSKAGLGYHIIVAEGLFNVNQIWVGVIGLVFIALFFNVATFPIEKWAKRWT